ncbi:MAG: hypothetical protein AAF492_29680, partial [Verrucomicrobiota bacterium]
MSAEPESLYRHSVVRTWGPLVLACVCILTCLGMVSYKMAVLGYRFTSPTEEERWEVELRMDVGGSERMLKVRAMPPLLKTPRQTVTDLKLLGEGFEMAQEGNHMVWSRADFKGPSRLMMKFHAETEPLRVFTPIGKAWDDLAPPAPEFEAWLRDEERIQINDPDIRALGQRLRNEHRDVTAFLRALYLHVKDEIQYIEIGGPTEARTCLLLGEGSCNGKNRLLVAVARS